jgi:hypothetical protein
MILRENHRVQLICKPGHIRIAGIETGESLVKQGSETPFIGPKRAYRIPDNVLVHSLHAHFTLSAVVLFISMPTLA